MATHYEYGDRVVFHDGEHDGLQGKVVFVYLTGHRMMVVDDNGMLHEQVQFADVNKLKEKANG